MNPLTLGKVMIENCYFRVLVKLISFERWIGHFRLADNEEILIVLPYSVNINLQFININ